MGWEVELGDENGDFIPMITLQHVILIAVAPGLKMPFPLAPDIVRNNNFSG